MGIIDRTLSVLFPVRNYIIRKPEELDVWLKHTVSIHSELDPYRPLGYFDSWAGKVKEKEQYESIIAI